jgi:hypothetical protein
MAQTISSQGGSKTCRLVTPIQGTETCREAQSGRREGKRKRREEGKDCKSEKRI